jgi:hypothetical protein
MDRRHGGAYDRGSADAYYGRPFRPHYFTGATHNSPEVTELTPAEVAEYREGYVNETDRKVWD